MLPAGRPNGFVVTSEAAGYLTMHHRPAFEEFTATAAGDAPDPARLTEIAAAHGIDVIGPPPMP